MNLSNEATRAYLYRIVGAVLALLLIYGIVGSDQIDSWDALIQALLGLGVTGLAVKNTSTKP